MNHAFSPETVPDIQCPVVRVPDVVPCEEVELQPLLDFLASDESITQAQTFPRGTVLPDGRLDLCKQSVGVGGCQRLVEAMRANSQIKSLLLGTDAIGDEGATHVAQLVENNSHLEIVYLGCNRITSSGAASLAQSLEHNTTVKGLWLKRNPIGDEGLDAIGQLLTSNSTLRTLDVVNCGFSVVALLRFCRVLQDQNRTLQRLYLGGNGLNTACAVALANVLRFNSSLTGLYLNVNILGDEGASELAQGLKNNVTLTELSIGSNGIGMEGLQGLAEAVATHPLLKALDIGRAASQTVLGAASNDFAAQGPEVLGDMLRRNRSLQRLNLRGTQMSSKELAPLFEAVRTHPCLVDLGVDSSLPVEVREQLALNLQRNGEEGASEDVTLIRSVYRTKSS